jgi:hypothetical protein
VGVDAEGEGGEDGKRGELHFGGEKGVARERTWRCTTTRYKRKRTENEEFMDFRIRR